MKTELAATTLLTLSFALSGTVEAQQESTNPTTEAQTKVELADRGVYHVQLPTGSFDAVAIKLWDPADPQFSAARETEFNSEPYYDKLSGKDRLGFKPHTNPDAAEGDDQTVENLYVHDYSYNRRVLAGTYVDKLVEKDGTTQYLHSNVTVTDDKLNQQKLEIVDSTIIDTQDLNLDDKQDNLTYTMRVLDWEFKHPEAKNFLITCTRPVRNGDIIVGSNAVKIVGLKLILPEKVIPETPQVPVRRGGGSDVLME